MQSKRIQHHAHTRALALDLHPRRFGYVVMESPGKLLDWGIRRGFRKTTNHPGLLIRRVRTLMNIWMPDVVVILIGDRREKALQSLSRQIKKEVGVSSSFLPIRNSPDQYLGRGKYERAVALAARFPEICWKLPSKRKPWESEHYSMSIFEALGVVVAFVS